MAQEVTPRIIHLVSSNGFYGAERVIANLAGAIGGDTLVACLCRSPESIRPFQQEVESKGISFRPMPFSLKAALNELAPLLDTNTLVLHAHGYKEAVLALLCFFQRRAKGKSTRVFVTQHGFTARNLKSRLYNFVNKASCRWGPVTGVVSVSPQIDAIYRQFGVPAKRLHTIANAVPTALPIDRQAARNYLAKEYQLNTELPWVGFAGRLSAEKNPVLMIELQQALQQAAFSCQLLIAGDGPQKAMLKAKIEEHGLNTGTRLLGFVDDMAQFLTALDVLVVPSLTEGMPMVVLEAMSRGVAVIAADVGGLPNIIEHAINGILVQGHQATDYAHQLKRLLGNRNSLEQLQQAARQTIQDHFSLENQASAYLRLYREASPA